MSKQVVLTDFQLGEHFPLPVGGSVTSGSVVHCHPDQLDLFTSDTVGIVPHECGRYKGMQTVIVGGDAPSRVDGQSVVLP